MTVYQGGGVRTYVGVCVCVCVRKKAFYEWGSGRVATEKICITKSPKKKISIFRQRSGLEQAQELILFSSN